MNEEIKNIGYELITKAEHLRSEQIAFITDVMAKKKELFTFDNFDKDDGEICDNDFDECEITDTNPIITAISWDDTTDYYLVGIEYIEQKEKREPYRIVFYGAPYNNPNYVKSIPFTDVSSESYNSIVGYIIDNV